MDKLYRIINKYGKRIFAGAIIVELLIPVVVVICYSGVYPPLIYTNISEDGILAYIICAISSLATLLIGFVAVSQNKEIEGHNEDTQNKLFNLTNKQIEMDTINKILDNQLNIRMNVDIALADFQTYASTNSIHASIIGNIDDYLHNSNELDFDAKSMSRVVNHINNLEEIYTKCEKILLMDCKKSVCKDDLRNIIKEMYQKGVLIMGEYANMGNYEKITSYNSIRNEKYSELNEVNKAFQESYVRYITHLTSRINRIMYENLSLEQVKYLCCDIEKN